jgi:hypothetical protein
MNIDVTDASEMVAYQRGVKRPQFLAGWFRFIGLFGGVCSVLLVVLAIAAKAPVLVFSGIASFVSALLLLAVSALLDWCAVLLMTLRYGTPSGDQ